MCQVSIDYFHKHFDMVLHFISCIYIFPHEIINGNQMREWKDIFKEDCVTSLTFQTPFLLHCSWTFDAGDKGHILDLHLNDIELSKEWMQWMHSFSHCYIEELTVAQLNMEPTDDCISTSLQTQIQFSLIFPLT
jgi:hypothetical protein